MTLQDSARIRSQISRTDSYDVDALVAIEQEIRADRTPNADTHSLIRDLERKSSDVVSQAMFRATNDGAAQAFAVRLSERTGNTREFTLVDVMGDGVMSGYVRQIVAERAERAAALPTLSARYQALAARMDGADTAQALDAVWEEADVASGTGSITIPELDRLAAIYESQQAILAGRQMVQVEDIAGTEHLHDMADRIENGVIGREGALTESELILEGTTPERAREIVGAEAAERAEGLRMDNEEDFEDDDDLDAADEYNDDARTDAEEEANSARRVAIYDSIRTTPLSDVAALVTLEGRVLALPDGIERDSVRLAFERHAGPLVQDALREMSAAGISGAFQERVRARTGRAGEFSLMDMVADDEVNEILRECAAKHQGQARNDAPAPQAPPARAEREDGEYYVPEEATEATDAAEHDLPGLADRLAEELRGDNASLEERLLAVINGASAFAEMENKVPGFRNSMAKLAKTAAEIAAKSQPRA